MSNVFQQKLRDLMLFTGVILIAGLLTASPVLGGDLSGKVGAEYRFFSRDAVYAGQHDRYMSLSFEPEYYLSWNSGRQGLLLAPFLRLDQHDGSRTHFDIRELYWQYVSDNWEFKFGLARVFWGVTESVHLVDIINQTDLVENPDGEDKLGQPMANLTLIRSWGTIDLFLLPGFRERTYPGIEGRLRSPRAVDTDNSEFESTAEQYHIDWTARWSHTIGDYDIGVAHFRGTGRDPDYLLRTAPADDFVPAPYYLQIDQTSLDVQATKGSWLWKLEAISQGGGGSRYTAAAAGFEYTLPGFCGLRYDLGILSEYLFDDRGENAPVPFEDDIFAGLRLALNDVKSTSLLMGAIVDRVDGSSAVFVEADRRVGNSWKLELEFRAFIGADMNDPLYSLRDDDFLQITIDRFF